MFAQISDPKESCLSNRNTLGMFTDTEKEAIEGLRRERTIHRMKS